MKLDLWRSRVAAGVGLATTILASTTAQVLASQASSSAGTPTVQQKPENPNLRGKLVPKTPAEHKLRELRDKQNRKEKRRQEKKKQEKLELQKKQQSEA